MKEKPKERTKDKPLSIRRWITGENRYDWAQVFGPLGAPYFRYDPSHHLHRQISRMRFAQNFGTHMLAVLLILTGILLVVDTAIPGIRILFAILIFTAGALVFLRRVKETKDRKKPIP